MIELICLDCGRQLEFDFSHNRMIKIFPCECQLSIIEDLIAEKENLENQVEDLKNDSI